MGFNIKALLFAFLSVGAVSLISLVGIFTLGFKEERLKRINLFLVSFATGVLFGGALIHLLPEAFAELGSGLNTSLLVIFGIILFFILEKFIRWRHCHLPTSSQHLHPVVVLNLLGDALHNLLDGMIIGAGFLISTPIGAATALAVIFHEIPQEIGDFGVLVHAGLSPQKALFFNFLSALSAFVGLFISLFLGHYLRGFTLILIPIAAGGFLYIAGSDLIPELQRVCEVKFSLALKQFFWMLFGVLAMVVLSFWE